MMIGCAGRGEGALLLPPLPRPSPPLLHASMVAVGAPTTASLFCPVGCGQAGAAPGAGGFFLSFFMPNP